MVGVDGFRFVYYHVEFEGTRSLLCFIVFRIWFWKVLMGSVSVLWNLFSFMKLCILESYCSVGRITRELPLSAFAIVALFLLSLDWMDFTVWVSRCVCLPWARCLCL
jgi:hypothetical protein